MQKLIKVLFFIGSINIMSACTEDRVFEENVDFEDKVWTIDHSVNFEFEIDNANKWHQVFMNLRYDASYPYRNIYITYHLNDSTQTAISKALANTQLFTDKLGKPIGESSSNVYSLQTILIDSIQFPFPGKYTFSMEQYMRTDSLTGVYSTGIKVVEHPTVAE